MGDFGVAACARGFKEGELEENGGIGHPGCVAEHQRLGAGLKIGSYISE